MDPTFWAKAHGATVHFPLAFALSSGGFDLAALLVRKRPIARELHAVGHWTIIVAAVSSLPAVCFGLLLTKGSVLGHGALRMHHLFVWPAFALLVALATWRALVGPRASRSGFTGYLTGVAILAALMSAAGYWGGEMLIR